MIHRRLLLCLLFSLVPLMAAPDLDVLREGDIVFSGSPHGQGEAIIAATGSKYTHCGIVFLDERGRICVLEAVQPVRITPIRDFMKRDSGKVFAVKRLRTPVTPDAYRKARQWAVRQVGKDYDPRFLWDDKNLYCSELVWKIYQKAGVRLCEPKRFRDYRLDRPEVKRIIAERFGSADRLPKDEQVVAPSDIAESELLLAVDLTKKS